MMVVVGNYVHYLPAEIGLIKGELINGPVNVHYL